MPAQHGPVAQAPDCLIEATFTADSTTPSFDNRGGPGTFNTFGGSSGLGTRIIRGTNPYGFQGSNPTQFLHGLAAVVPWVRGEISSITGAGSGQIVIYGYKAAPQYRPAELPTYNAAIISNASAASKDYLTIFNGVGSLKILRITRIRAAAAPTAAITGLVAALTMSKVSTAGTTCTAVTIRALDSNNNPLPAQITVNNNCTTDPTVTFSWGGCAVDTEETRANNVIECYHSAFYNPGNPLVTAAQPIVLREGEGIMVANTALAPAGPISLNIEFTAADQ